MTSYIWTENTKPDRPGIWALKDKGSGDFMLRIITAAELHLCHVGTWAFLMDLPDIIHPPKYRDVTAADVGRICEFSNHANGWNKRELLAVLPERCNERFIASSSIRNQHWNSWKLCRILDTREPLEPREWWCNIHGDSLVHSRKTKNEVERFGLSGAEVIHVREVIE